MSKSGARDGVTGPTEAGVFHGRRALADIYEYNGTGDLVSDWVARMLRKG